MGQTNFRKANTNIKNYVKTQMGENHRKRDKFHYSNGDYNDILWCGRVSGLSSLSPSAFKGIYYLYRLCLLDKAVESSSV